MSISSESSSDAWAGFKLWYYAPSLPLAITFTATFGVLTCLNLLMLSKYRTWFCLPFVVGGTFEIVGYAFRAVAHGDLSSIPAYTIQSLLLLLAPILFAASVYMILGRIVNTTKAHKYSVIKVKWLSKIFVTGDVLCFCIQGGGGGALAVAKTKGEIDRDNYIILGGLILQILIFFVFLATALIFHGRLRGKPTLESQQLSWQKLLVGLYLLSLLIMARNVFRVIEYGMGNTGYPLNHEWTLYVFDGVFMLAVLALALPWYKTPIFKLDSTT